MNTANTPGKTVWVDTSLHRCTAMEEDIAYPLPDYHQGRQCMTRVPRVSMFAGTPSYSQADDGMKRTVARMVCVLVAVFLCVVAIVMGGDA